MDYRIAIAGIGGLALAALLARDGHDVTLFERFAAPRPLGSGLVIHLVGAGGHGPDRRGRRPPRLSSPITRMLGHGADGRKALDVSYPAHALGRGTHRATLFRLPMRPGAGAGPAGRDLGRGDPCAPQRPRRRLHLADGRAFGPFDLVVDAGGAGSRLSPLQARPLGYGAIWGTVPWTDAGLSRDRLRQRYRGASRMAGILPIGRLPDDPTPLAAIFWSMPRAELDPWPRNPGWRAELAAFWPQMLPFLDHIRDDAQMSRRATAMARRTGLMRRDWSISATRRIAPARNWGRARIWRCWTRWRSASRCAARWTRPCRITPPCAAGMSASTKA